ncbi:MAG: translation elongation factor Ts [Acidobacteria bacterium]|nr:MAG: translation elongation factor Ts [Acidobacteriota bacterium]
MSTTTVNISAAQVKELREKTGAPMMDCKQALTEAKGDFEQAVVVLRKKGVSVAAKKATRVTSEGSVASYIHAGGKIGVLVEINCESDFVARTDDFKELVHDIAMHIAASDPKYVRKEDVTAADFAREKEIYLSLKDPTISISQLITTKIGKLGENISVRRFARFKVGDAGETIAISKPEQKPE